MNTLKKRNLLTVILLFIVTFGLYYFYWIYKTKEEINRIGGKIPTLWFAILPIFNIYFAYRYAQDFVKYVRQQDDPILVILFFLVLLCFPVCALLIMQYELNNYQINNSNQ